jgi:hypothetical protein
MKSLKLYSILVLVVAVIAVGCSKGTTGPAGPAGPAGPDSVVYGGWQLLNLVYNANDQLDEQTIPAPGITQQILDSGVILTYVGQPNGNGGASDVASGSVFLAEYGVSEDYSVGSISLAGDTNLVNGLDYRYVVVPGKVSDGTMVSGPLKGMTKQQVQDMSYAEITKIVGIPSKQQNGN